MSQNIAISVENLGKMYRIGKAVHRPADLREAVLQGIAAPFDYLKRKVQGPSDDEVLWALKDVSFEVKEGEVLGIIGRNGAGKSTLLKILSRITEPTTGHAEIRGRVNSLLEVGTGFHPELTGRENIYMNAAMHGMKRREINAKLDEIIAFAEVEKFIDTPVKRYSSGMYTRLAFAVAAHLEPDILIVDEVLAVGDVTFQKKCLGKMQDVAGQGRTVLFVSHNMNMINRLCGGCILMSEGTCRSKGNSREITCSYLNAGSVDCGRVVFKENTGKDIQYESVQIETRDGQIQTTHPDDQEIAISMSFAVRKQTEDVYFGLQIQNMEGVSVIYADSRDIHDDFPGRFNCGLHTASIIIPAVLAPGRYQVSIGIASVVAMQDHDYYENCCSFEVVNYTSARGRHRSGVLNMHIPWKIR